MGENGVKVLLKHLRYHSRFSVYEIKSANSVRIIF